MLANIDLNSIAVPGGVLYTIDQMVDALDTSAIEAKYDLLSNRGAEPIHPKTILKVGLYAMHNCRFSLRKMEQDIQFNLGYQWLTGNEPIDHSTLGKFFAAHAELISELFSQVVFACTEKDLLDFDVLGIDSVKIRANASYKQFRTMEAIEKEEQKIQEKLQNIIEGALREETQHQERETRALQARQNKLAEAKQILRKRIELKSQGKNESEQKKIVEKEKINITDPDCTLVQQGNGEINPAYAITSATDSKQDVISGFTVQEGYNDGTALLPAIAESEKNCSQPHECVAADSGFSTIENLEALARKNQDALIPDKRQDIEERGETKRGEYDRSNFRYDETQNVYVCPAKQVMAVISTIIRNGRKVFIYANKAACACCPRRFQCTAGEWRSITRDSNEAIREQMRSKFQKSENQEIYKLRAHCAESPYGQIKHNLKYRIFMRRGRSKVKMEASMLFMLHNILKAA